MERAATAMDGKFRGPIVVVDVQPFYCTHWDRTADLMSRLSAHRGPVCFLVNAEETGVCPDTRAECHDFWMENGLEEDVLIGARVIDKGYGFLRAWMDLGVDPDVTIAVIRRMRDEGVTDSRDLDEDVLRGIVGDEWQDWMLDDPVMIGSISDPDLEGMRGARICGGARDECLAEVELLLRAYDIPFERVEEFVYSDLPTAAPSGPRW